MASPLGGQWRIGRFLDISLKAIPSSHDRRRAIFLLVINAMLLLTSLGLIAYKGLQEATAVQVVSNGLLNLTVIVLILTRRYKWAAGLFVVMQPVLNFINFPASDLNSLLYVATAFLAASLFLIQSRLIILYGLILLGEITLAAILWPASAQFTVLHHDDMFIFFGLGTIFVMISALMVTGDQRQIEAQTHALRVSEERYRNLVANAPVGIFETDSSGRITFVNPYWRNLMGITDNPAIQNSLTWGTLLHPDDRERLIQEWNQAVSAGIRLHIESRAVGVSGNVVWVVAEAVPMYDQAHRLTHYLGTITDVTAIKEAQRAMAVANENLDSFASIISHDLKAPLRGVHSLVSWLQEDYAAKLDDQAREWIGLIQKRLLHMDAMIYGITQYSRVGREGETISRVDFNDVMEDVMDSITTRDRVHIVIENRLPTLRIERTHVLQVFQNLIDNAVKYCDKPVAEIGVSCTLQEKGWMFRVRDNGIGIAQKDYARVFEIFQTIRPPDRDSVPSSTGVGLAIVKRVINYYGGEIWVESELGQGSTFVFTLPVLAA
ncbi:MAG: ATP-binding protein [Anaerolineae bacterium]